MERSVEVGKHRNRGSPPWLRRRSGISPEPSRMVFCEVCSER